MKIEIGNGGFGSMLILFLVVGFFIPEIYAVIAVVWVVMCIAGLCADAQVKQALKADTSSKLRFNIPQIQTPTEPFCPKEGDEEQVEVAIQEARRIASLTNCSHESRKKIFEHVFHRECQQRGLKVSKVIWKSS